MLAKFGRVAAESAQRICAAPYIQPGFQMRKIISLICLVLPIVAWAGEPRIRDNAPDQHIVVRGDTLWDIASHFFDDPWQWQHIWGLNRDTIKDPHWIYPGDIVRLDRHNGTLHVATNHDIGNTLKLSPQVHTGEGQSQAIPPIPTVDIEPFLKRPLIIGENDLRGAPRLVATLNQRVALSTDDIAYFRGLPDRGIDWQIYRPGKPLIDPDSREVLGYEAIYLGDARVERFGEPSSVRITRATQEILKGDRLIAKAARRAQDLIPHAAEAGLSAKVISIHGESTLAGQHSVVTINKGTLDGIENGHVLALSRIGEKVRDNEISECREDSSHCTDERDITLPELRYGLLLIFRTFDRVAYALVMQTEHPVELLDLVRTP